MTEACNFKCSYCYQKRGSCDLEISTGQKAIDFFYPFFSKKHHINFSGGEPLLVFDRIEPLVQHINENKHKSNKETRYSITTNGSLLNDRILGFLNDNHFSLIFSFDGLAQDVAREMGSFEPLVAKLKQIQMYSDITLQTNSVFTPETVGYLARSIRFILELGIADVVISLATNHKWDSRSLHQLKNELNKVKEVILKIYEKTKKVPISNFRQNSNRGVFYCQAGEDRMTLTPDGRLWGCHLFADHLKGRENSEEYNRFNFGNLDDFIGNHETVYPETVARYSDLSMALCYTSETHCLECDELKECLICPVDTVFYGQNSGWIPGYICEINKILRKAQKNFWKELEN